MTSTVSIILDIETLDTVPTAVVTEIGIVAINRADFEIVAELDLQLDHFAQLADGRTFSADTLAFHRAKGTLPTHFSDLLPPSEACVMFMAFFRQNPPHRVWIHGQDFDRPILQNLLADHGLELPWPFYATRDARTAWDLAFPNERPAKRPHVALQDARATRSDILKALTQLSALDSI